MDHIAIDLGGRESQICVRTSDGTITEELKWPTGHLGRWLRERPKSRVVVETSAEAFAVADAALELGHEVRVVAGTLVRSLGVGARGIKTDRRDAQVLSEVSCRIDLPSVHVPGEVSRQRKTVCGMREELVEARTRLVNSVRGYLRTQLVRVRTGSPKTFPERVREKLVERPEGMPACVERQLRVIEVLNEQIAEADGELEQAAKADPVCQRLMTVPGVGPVVSLRFAAALDQVERFPNAHAVESYLGLVPGEDSSSQRVRRTSITKAGASKVRWALNQACWVAVQRRPHDPMVEWAKQVARRRGKQIAIVALQRKMAGILYALWRDGTEYQPARGAQVTNERAAERAMHA